ncbi:hypothetical protein [Prevotella sp. 10(H)]|uniref:baeRF3 domain-containing protein n=1 Tax=Prevotella sp. 10(H) TaxID=1158294 RepID=UPI0004A75992|nr:hypothetical protein [Prevotella sp. 10(H)]
MTLKEKIKKLANETNNPCVTISLNTHRTHPDSLKDEILLKNLLNEADKRVTDEYGKRSAATVLNKISDVADKINRDHNLDSLHIFLSQDTEEIIKLSWPTYQDKVSIGNTFDVRPLIKAYNRSTEYLILVLSQGGVTLYDAVNDNITKEIKNDDFRFGETPYYIPDREERSDAKRVDDMIREFFNQVDKALIKVANEKELKCIVICTEDNFSKLMEVSDNPETYTGHALIDYDKSKPHDVVKQGWEIIKNLLEEQTKTAIAEMDDAVSQHKVLTDLQEIYQAAIDGRGDVLIIYEDFSQPVRMNDERTFEFIAEATSPEENDDIISDIAWEVMSKGGKVFFTKQEEIRKFGDIVLRTRY